MTYESAVDTASLVAIDTHVHIEVDDSGHAALPQALVDAASKYFKADGPRPGLDEIAQLYRERHMAAVVFTVDAMTSLRHAPISSEEIAQGASRNNDVLIPFGSVDPHRSDAASRMRRLAEDFGVRGFKFHPTVQNFDPSDTGFYPLYELIQEWGLPVIFHTGQTGIGAGLPGGFGPETATAPTRCCSTTSPPTFPLSRLSWRIPRCRGRTKPSPWPPTRRTSGSICPGGPRSISLRTWCGRRTRSCRTRCCSVRFPAHHPGSLAEGLLGPRGQGGGAAEDPQGERDPSLGVAGLTGGHFYRHNPLTGFLIIN